MTKKLFWMWLIILLLLNVLPLGNEVNTKLRMGIGKGELRTDYLAHALTYLFFAGIYALKWLRGDMVFKHHELPSIICIILTSAILFEAIQYVLPWRAFNPMDLLSNLTGACLAGLIILISNYYISKKNNSTKPS